MTEMFAYAYVHDGALQRVGSRPNWLDDAGQPVTDAVLAENNWHPVQDADPIPEGKVSGGQSIELVDGLPKQVDALQDAPPDPDAGFSTQAPTLFAAAQLTIENGEIFGIGVNSRFAGAFILDVGLYYVMFVEPMPDTDYMAMVAAVGPCSAYVDPINKSAEAFIITVTTASGEPVDVSAVNVSIMRA